MQNLNTLVDYVSEGRRENGKLDVKYVACSTLFLNMNRILLQCTWDRPYRRKSLFYEIMVNGGNSSTEIIETVSFNLSM